MFNKQPSPTTKLAALSARLTTLQSIATKWHNTISDSDLVNTNGTLKVLLANSIRDVNAPLAGTKPSKVLAASESEKKKKIDTEFTNAKLNVQFDSTYAREMAYQLSIVHSMMKTLYSSSNSKSLKNLLATTDNNLSPIQKSFEKFSASKE